MRPLARAIKSKTPAAIPVFQSLRLLSEPEATTRLDTAAAEPDETAGAGVAASAPDANRASSADSDTFPRTKPGSESRLRRNRSARISAALW